MQRYINRQHERRIRETLISSTSLTDTQITVDMPDCIIEDNKNYESERCLRFKRYKGKN